jgi:hypothetical protein
MSEPDTLMGRVATALILDIDGQLQNVFANEQEVSAWEKFRSAIDWKRLALSSIEALDASIGYVVDEARQINRSKGDNTN